MSLGKDFKEKKREHKSDATLEVTQLISRGAGKQAAKAQSLGGGREGKLQGNGSSQSVTAGGHTGQREPGRLVGLSAGAWAGPGADRKTPAR